MKIGDRVTLNSSGGYGPSSVFFAGAKGTIVELEPDLTSATIKVDGYKDWAKANGCANFEDYGLYFYRKEFTVDANPCAEIKIGDKRKVLLNIDLDTDPEGEADVYDNVTRIRITRVLTLQEGRDFIKAIAPIMKSSIVA